MRLGCREIMQWESLVSTGKACSRRTGAIDRDRIQQAPASVYGSVACSPAFRRCSTVTANVLGCGDHRGLDLFLFAALFRGASLGSSTLPAWLHFWPRLERAVFFILRHCLSSTISQEVVSLSVIRRKDFDKPTRHC